MVFNAQSRWVRVCAIQALLLVALTAVATRTSIAHPADADAAAPRVRSTNAAIRALMTEAATLSRTFRGLIDGIEATDGIVYVETGRCGHGVRACLMMTVTPAAGYRILRILIDMRPKPWDIMASIGHELRHAIEVLENRSLVDAATVYLFYAQGGRTDGQSFETRAAVEAGFAVRNEVESSFNAAR